MRLVRGADRKEAEQLDGVAATVNVPVEVTAGDAVTGEVARRLGAALAELTAADGQR